MVRIVAGEAMPQEEEDGEGRKRYRAGFSVLSKTSDPETQEGRHGAQNGHFPTRGCTRQCQ